MIRSEIKAVTLKEMVNFSLGFALTLNDFLRKGSCLHTQTHNKDNVNTKVQENIQMLVTICCLMREKGRSLLLH